MYRSFTIYDTMLLAMLDATVSEQLQDAGYPNLISMSIKRTPQPKATEISPKSH